MPTKLQNNTNTNTNTPAAELPDKANNPQEIKRALKEIINALKIGAQPAPTDRGAPIAQPPTAASTQSEPPAPTPSTETTASPSTPAQQIQEAKDMPDTLSGQPSVETHPEGSSNNTAKKNPLLAGTASAKSPQQDKNVDPKNKTKNDREEAKKMPDTLGGAEMNKLGALNNPVNRPTTPTTKDDRTQEKQFGAGPPSRPISDNLLNRRTARSAGEEPDTLPRDKQKEAGKQFTAPKKPSEEGINIADVLKTSVLGETYVISAIAENYPIIGLPFAFGTNFITIFKKQIKAIQPLAILTRFKSPYYAFKESLIVKALFTAATSGGSTAVEAASLAEKAKKIQEAAEKVKKVTDKTKQAASKVGAGNMPGQAVEATEDIIDKVISWVLRFKHVCARVK